MRKTILFVFLTYLLITCSSCHKLHQIINTESVDSESVISKNKRWSGEVENKKDSDFREYTVLKATQKRFTGIVRDTLTNIDGTVEYREVTFSNGLQDGRTTVHSQLGQLMSECDFKNGYMHGKYKTYYPNGQLSQDEILEWSKPQGLQLKYTEEGQVWSENLYVGDSLYAKKYYYNRDVLSSECSYKSKDPKTFIQKHGEEKLYNREGVLYEKNIYYFGELISTETMTND